MPKPLQEALRGKWGPGTSGGCPRVPSWTKNPQYLLTPSAAGNFTISLRCNAQPRLDIGFVVLHQAAAGGRKTSAKVNKRELVHKTTWKPIDLQTADIDLRPAESTGAMAYIIVPCTFDAGQQAAFDLTVSSVSGVPFTITELSETPSRPAVQPVQPTAANIAAANVGEGASKPADAGVLAGAGAQPTGSATAKPAGYATADTVAPVGENEVQAVSEGQGLSRRQQADVTKLVAEALASAEQSPTGLYEDEAFSAGPSALWIDGRGPGAELQASGLTADPVASWRRPSEYAAELPGSDGSPRLFNHDYGGIQGVIASPLLNRWLLAACNIVGGDLAVLERVFVDSTHAEKGFYVVRFYVDDPHSDDDWQVVLIDDRLPCGADGLPCFARTPNPAVLWLPILEKAFAKLKGTYEGTSGGSVEDGLLYLTGGLSRELGVVQSSDRDLVDALWAQMMEWWTTSHVIGCEHRIDGEASPELMETGLLPNLPYCVVTGGEPNGNRMVRLRTFHGYSEWKGKWSDDDKSWTSAMRHLLSYRRDGDDGTFWMAFEDFVLWFNVIFTCRMADDRWTRLTVRSKWEGATAGGCCPNFATWRTNPQWLLTTAQPLRLTLSLSVPAPAGGTADHASLFPPETALGITVLKGNPGADAKRRKLLLTAADELVVRAEPRQVRRLVQEVLLEPSPTPYVLMPHTFAPGRETPFTLTVRCDDENDDGLPDFTLEPVRQETDWCHKTHDVTWAKALETCAPATAPTEEDDGKRAALKVALRRQKAAAGADDDDSDDDDDKLGFNPAGAEDDGAPGGAPGAAGFASNPQIALKVEKAGRFFVVVDQIDVELDGRTWEGMQTQDELYPAVGVAVLASVAALDDGKLDDEEILQNEHANADAAMLACDLAASEVAYCVVPYLLDPTAALERHPRLRCRVHVYSDVPFTLGSRDEGLGDQHAMGADGRCICWNLGKMPDQQNEMTCPILRVYNSLKKMERGLDRQLKYLDTLAAFPRQAGFANKDGTG